MQKGGGMKSLITRLPKAWSKRRLKRPKPRPQSIRSTKSRGQMVKGRDREKVHHFKIQVISCVVLFVMYCVLRSCCAAGTSGKGSLFLGGKSAFNNGVKQSGKID